MIKTLPIKKPKIRRRIWFLEINNNTAKKIGENKIVEKLETFASKHLKTQWAINPSYKDSEGRSSFRAVIIVKNACTLRTINKNFNDFFTYSNAREKSVLSFLFEEGTYNSDALISSQNWDWKRFVMCNREDSKEDSRTSSISVKVNNLFVLVDQSEKKYLFEALRKAL